ncbi:MAG: PTS sugar transporter subunit IIA [bacterium]
MIGVLLISHEGIGREMMETAELILGKTNITQSISIRAKDQREEMLKIVEKEARELLKECSSIIIMTDMWGASPTNIALESAKRLKKDGLNVGLVSGFNLPMLITAIAYQREMELADLIKKIIEVGKMSHIDATKII